MEKHRFSDSQPSQPALPLWSSFCRIFLFLLRRHKISKEWKISCPTMIQEEAQPQNRQVWHRLEKKDLQRQVSFRSTPDFAKKEPPSSQTKPFQVREEIICVAINKLAQCTWQDQCNWIGGFSQHDPQGQWRSCLQPEICDSPCGLKSRIPLPGSRTAASRQWVWWITYCSQSSGIRGSEPHPKH